VAKLKVQLSWLLKVFFRTDKKPICLNPIQIAGYILHRFILILNHKLVMAQKKKGGEPKLVRLPDLVVLL